ncbi:MAG: GntR family transcriptional regulator [Lentisphaerae bacterium]|nr:GntR family transcriptional regulator [Lentisphaerota bacterium]
MAILQTEIANHLMSLIEQGQHGDMLPSQNELRRQFNVSTVTVRKALEKLEEQGVIYRHQGKGCFIRRPQNHGVTTRLFLIISSKFSLDNEFISSLVYATQVTGYHTIFYHFDGNAETMFYELNRFAPQVVIWLAPSIFMHEKALLKLLTMPQHVILFNREYNHSSISYISGDFIGDGRRMAKVMLEKDIRNVLYLTLDERMMFARKRGMGLREEIIAGGGKFDSLDGYTLRNRIFAEGESVDPLDTRTVLKQALKERLSSDSSIQAIVCSQGKIWPTLKEALVECGKSPEDFVLASFNKLDAAEQIPGHTIAFDQPISRMASDIIALAGRLLNGGEPEQLIYPSELICQ